MGVGAGVYMIIIIIIMIIIAIISIPWYLIDKGEHTMLYKVSQTYKIWIYINLKNNL